MAIDLSTRIGAAADQHRTFMEMPRLPGNWRNYVPADSLDAPEPS